MYRLLPDIPNYAAIKNIIFDFGGVICDLDITKTEKKFKDFGAPKSLYSNSSHDHSRQFNILVEDLETGAISPKQFREVIKNHFVTSPTDSDINNAWNAMILNIPEERISLLKKLRNQFRIFLLSNSNQIHYEKYLQDFKQQTGYLGFHELFEKAYFSFEIGLKKPGKAIYEFVLGDSNLNPDESLFIDDTPENVQGAEDAGINGYYLKNGTKISDIFFPVQ
jgi:FMN phosphatase YigB (HAD superfamily)